MHKKSPVQKLLPHQRKAFNYIKAHALKKKAAARAKIKAILNLSGWHEQDYEKVLQNFCAHAKIMLHFHPERLSQAGQTVIEGLLLDGVYKNQFDTGISSGSPTAFPGGQRDLWEKQFFGGFYHTPNTSPSERPKYGALEMLAHPDGPAPRFGSCYFVLSSDIAQRSTFTFGGSQDDLNLERTGTLDAMDTNMAAILKTLEQNQEIFGVDNMNVSTFLEKLNHSHLGSADQPLGNALDSFVEAQIHGSIYLKPNVERLVADSSYRGSSVETFFKQLCERYHIQLIWHPGYTLSVAEVPETFRGYPTKAMAKRIVRDGMLNAAKIGAASNSFYQDPESWMEFGTYQDIITCFRRIWHVLVKCGRPINPSPSTPD